MGSLHLEQNDIGAIYQLLTAGRKADLSISAVKFLFSKQLFIPFMLCRYLYLPTETAGRIFFLFFTKWYAFDSAPGSAVGIGTGYGLGGPGIESRWEARFSAPVQTGPGTHPASCTVGTGSFQGVKCGGGVLLTPHPLLVPW